MFGRSEHLIHELMFQVGVALNERAKRVFSLILCRIINFDSYDVHILSSIKLRDITPLPPGSIDKWPF